MALSSQIRQVTYQGKAELGINEIEATFTIDAAYNRKGNSDFIVVIDGQKRYPLGVWVDRINASTLCSEVTSPRGISDIMQIRVDRSEISFTLINNQMSIQEMITYVSLPSFALAPGIALKTPNGMLA